MISKAKLNDETKNLFSFLPSNLLSELDESEDYSNKASHKGSNVSIFIYLFFFLNSLLIMKWFQIIKIILIIII